MRHHNFIAPAYVAGIGEGVRCLRRFNWGLRAYYFALAMMLWFVHAWVFVAAAALVLGVLYRREFRSKSLGTLADILAAR